VIVIPEIAGGQGGCLRGGESLASFALRYIL
jgi:hypothetical protein